MIQEYFSDGLVQPPTTSPLLAKPAISLLEGVGKGGWSPKIDTASWHGASFPSHTPQPVYYQQKKGRFALNIMILQINLGPLLGTPKHDHINCHYLLSNFPATQRFFISFDVVTWFSLSVFQRKNSDKIRTKRCHWISSTLNWNWGCFSSVSFCLEDHPE